MATLMAVRVRPALFAFVLVGGSSTLSAQGPIFERSLSLGVSRTDEAKVSNPRGSLIDFQLRRWNDMAATRARFWGGGIGAILGGTSDACALQSDGRCGSAGNFAYANLAAGVSAGLGRSAIIGSTELTLSHFEQRAAIGAAVRLEVTTQQRRAIRPGVMLRLSQFKAGNKPKLSMAALAASLHF